MKYKKNKESKLSDKQIQLADMVIAFTIKLKNTVELYGLTEEENIKSNEAFGAIYNIANEFMYINDLMLEVIYKTLKK